MTSCGHMQFSDATPDIGEIGLGVAALRYASLGFAVVPLVRGGKKPHRMLPASGGVHHATRDPGHIHRWWKTDPAASIGVATGSVSGLCVVDLDVKGEANGIDSLQRFLYSRPGGIYGIPAGPCAQTPSGGWHIWLRWWPGYAVPERPGILPGVDVKGDGGLVVAPPSMRLVTPLARPGERPSDPVPVPYAWHGCPCQAPMAPDWLPPWLASAPATGNAAGGAQAAWPGEVPDAGKLKRDGIPRGERNQVMYRLACSLYRRNGSNSAEVLTGLWDVWQATDHSDFPWSEVQTIAASARKFVAESEKAEAGLQQQILRWLER